MTFHQLACSLSNSSRQRPHPAACQQSRAECNRPPRLWRRPSASASDAGAESSLLLPCRGHRVLMEEPRISTSVGCFLAPAARLPAGRAGPPLWRATTCPGVEALRRWRWPAVATACVMKWPLSTACRQTDHVVREWRCTELLSKPPPWSGTGLHPVRRQPGRW